MKTGLSLTLVAAVLVVIPDTFAQTPVPARRIIVSPDGFADVGFPATITSGRVEVNVVQPQNAATTAAASDSARIKQRKSILDKLTFDRRPSSILKAWSTPPGSEDDEDAEKAKEATEQPAETKVEEPAVTEELTEEQKQAQEAAKKAAAQAKAAAEKLQLEIKQLQADVDLLKRNVTLGQWPDVREFLGSLEEAESKSLYEKLLQSLVVGPPDQPKTRNGQIIGERNVIRASDVMALGEMCPEEKLEEKHTAILGQLANLCQTEGQAEYIFLDTLKEHVAAAADDQKINKRAAARILFAANRIDEAKSFLPTVADAAKEQDTEALSILTDVFLRLYQRKTEKSLLEESWHAAQALLRSEKSDDAQAQKAMRRCVQLVPMIRKDLGQQWLTDSFTSEPEQGIKILAGIGGASAQSMKDQAGNPDERVATLKLQQTAVAALLKTAPQKAQSWSSTLHLLAGNWLREATYSGKYDSSTQRGPTMTRDMYGNYFWSGNNSSSSSRPPSGMPQPIPGGKVLDVRPDDEWLKFLEPGYRSQFSIETARLHLRVKEEAEAFPYIEQLAETHKDEARDLVQEFLDVWAANHDPNTENRRTSIYMFSYGFSQRASGIPLTRSRQVRNLDELAGWVARIRKLPLEDIDERWISAAFKRVHSAAEVYQQHDMERVFGDTDGMKAETLAALLQTMRTNLAGIWRKPDVQKQSKTNRKQQEIEAEVVKGYEAARLLLNTALDDHPDSWELQLVRAAIMHDENDYRSELQNSTDFATARKSALAAFSQSVDSYAKTLPDKKESEYTVEPFQFWFNAALGAPDLDQITQEKLPVMSQMPLIRAAFDRLPEESGDRHIEMFANDLFTRMSRVNPAVKFRYIREGLAIVGEREQSREARKVLDYYNDLVTEIKIETVLDGSPAVGHQQPFGVYVNLRHTKAIERESGGFAKYLQNQNSGGYSYNYGRPTENYREKFEEYARDALDEHFEVLSITFQPESVASRATEEPGWRTTSYAYVLLQARGPEIDRIAPLKLDLDFLDTTGYVVLPVESQAVLVDCTTTDTDLRPSDKLSVTQTLDERQSKDKKLVLEVKATAQGLVPQLDEILDLKFADFEVESVEDNGLSVSRFDPEHNEPVVVSDRLWTIALKDKDATAQDKRTFMFASAKLPLHEEIWQRYDDADLVAVDQSVTLQETYDEPNRTAQIVGFGAALLLICGGLALWLLRKPKHQEAAGQRFVLPEKTTPFNVLTLLKDIERNNGLSIEGKADLATSISSIERYFFAEQKDEAEPDLLEVAQTWVRKAR